MIKQVAILIFISLTFAHCGQGQIKTPGNAMKEFEKFKEKEKFGIEKSYPGIADPKMRPILTKKINKVADNFNIVAQKSNPTNDEYQNQIKLGLESFADVYISLDTEDRERVCHYFEEIMDIVGLESSEGKLNDFMYGFDPGKFGKQ